MDSSEHTAKDDMKRKYRTVWVGNLHPKVTEDIVAELFFQMGPIECVQFGYDDYNRCENFAWVTFKYESSVYDCMKIFQGTKLYGLTIKMKNYLDYPEEQRFDEELDNFKELIRVECGNRDSNTKNIYNYEGNIPESLPQPPIHSSNYDFDINSKHKFESESKYSEINYHESNTGKYHPTNPLHSRRNQFLKSERNLNSLEASSDVWLDCNREYSNKYSENYQSRSSNRNNNRFYNQEHFSDNHNSSKHVVPVRDLRDTMHRKRLSSNDIQNDSNAACTSSLDLRDIINPSSSSSNKDRRYDGSNSYGNWHDKHRNNLEQNYNAYSERKLRNKHFESEHYNKHDMNHHNNANSQDHHDRKFTDELSFNNYDDSRQYSNNHGIDYNQKDSRSNSYGHNYTRSSRNFGNRQQSNHPYKRNGDNRERKGRVVNNDQYGYSYNANAGGYNSSKGRHLNFKF